VYICRVKEDLVEMMERDEIELPDFPWKREEAWMKLESDVREHLARLYPDSDYDDKRIGLLLDKVRSAFDRTWEEVQLPTIEYSATISTAEDVKTLARRIVALTCAQFQKWLDMYANNVLAEMTKLEFHILTLEEELREARRGYI
jgi:hypothetical protein